MKKVATLYVYASIMLLFFCATTSTSMAQTTQEGTELRESPCHGFCIQGATTGPGCWQDIVHDEHEREDECTNYGYDRRFNFPYPRMMGNGTCDRFWPEAQTHLRCFSTSDLAASQCQINGFLSCPRPGGGFNRYYYDISCHGPSDRSARIPMAMGSRESAGCAGEDVNQCYCESGAMVCQTTAPFNYQFDGLWLSFP